LLAVVAVTMSQSSSLADSDGFLTLDLDVEIRRDELGVGVVVISDLPGTGKHFNWNRSCSVMGDGSRVTPAEGDVRVDAAAAAAAAAAAVVLVVVDGMFLRVEWRMGDSGVGSLEGSCLALYINLFQVGPFSRRLASCQQ
jgi:hypothetical protein